MQIVKDKITLAGLKQIAENMFGDLVKAVVDIEKKIMVIGGELHADEEAKLIDRTGISKLTNFFG